MKSKGLKIKLKYTIDKKKIKKIFIIYFIMIFFLNFLFDF